MAGGANTLVFQTSNHADVSARCSCNDFFFSTVNKASTVTPLYVPNELGGWETLEMGNRHLAPRTPEGSCGPAKPYGTNSLQRGRVEVTELAVTRWKVAAMEGFDPPGPPHVKQ